MKRAFTIGILILALAVGAQAGIISGYAGSGSNTATCVIDFGATSYAFNYSFDGSKTGWDMIQALDAETGLDITYTDYGWGIIVDSFSYGAQSEPNGVADDGMWWSYWTSTDGSTWASSWVGCTDRVLADGDWDGWSWTTSDENWNPVDAPSAPVPEPGTLLGLASLAGAAWVGFRRRA
ncbi:MAG: PEP-CTERM sorting domain-containing protein [Armatimonadota bacterium]